MPEISCYSMDLYCDQPGHDPRMYKASFTTFTGNTRAQAVRAARRAGRRFHQNGLVSCPFCTGPKPTKSCFDDG